jgi:hypothetical protein
MATTSTQLTSVRTPLLARPPAVAGVIYVSAWLTGLAVLPSGPALDAAGRELALHYAGNSAAVAVQSLLVHGVAGVSLVAVALGVARVGGTVRRPARLLVVAAVTAAVLSAVQMAAGLVAATTVGAGAAGRAASLFSVVGRVDGLKMLALAAMVAAGVTLARHAILPRWLAWVGYALVAFLVPAAVGHLFMSAPLATSAAPALILLLVWVCGAGIAVARR